MTLVFVLQTFNQISIASITLSFKSRLWYLYYRRSTRYSSPDTRSITTTTLSCRSFQVVPDSSYAYLLHPQQSSPLPYSHPEAKSSKRARQPPQGLPGAVGPIRNP